jgi:hypothetical protein
MPDEWQFFLTRAALIMCGAQKQIRIIQINNHSRMVELLR